jgi:hypothetical protein
MSVVAPRAAHHHAAVAQYVERLGHGGLVQAGQRRECFATTPTSSPADARWEVTADDVVKVEWRQRAAA